MLKRFLRAAVLCLGGAAQAQNCGPDAPCEIEGGSYFMRVPDGAGPHPVLIWYHGHRGSGASIHRGGGLQRDFLEQGYVIIAPNGFQRDDGVRSYPARQGSPRDDVAFTFEVLEAAADRVSIDRTRVYAAGFSAGGSMAWLLACEAGGDLAGMVSVSGALREPNDTDCAGLADLPVMQVHGFADGQVPFEGRAIGNWHQGSVWESLRRAREANGCRTNPDDIEIGDQFRNRVWDASCTGAPVRLMVHDGGHGLPAGWTTEAREFLESAGSDG